jgi:beta-galactosidase
MLDALRSARTRILALFFAAPLFGSSSPRESVHVVNVTELRSTTRFVQNWSFIQDDNLTDSDALAGNTAAWSMVTLPHTWNAKDAAGLHVTKPYKRGIGWYRLEFDTPRAGNRHWLEFGAASIVADVWLNGQKLGQHKGAFTIFRFDVTDQLAATGKNTLVVKVDNRAPEKDDDVTAIIPLAGDFNMSGGLYRYVSIISTAAAAHFDLADMGGPGVYATTTSILPGTATIEVRTKLHNDSKQDSHYIVRISMVDANGGLAGTADRNVPMKTGTAVEVMQRLDVNNPHLWQGIEDPYQYRLVAELIRPDGTAIDRVVQNFGIRQMRFDPNEGFSLNGKHVPLHGVAMHQDFFNKGWAISDKDMDESLTLIKEIGANTVRLAHYPYSQYALDSVDKLGLIAWAEVPFGIGVTVEPPIQLGSSSTNCPNRDATPALRANANQQLTEMIRQQYNHPAIAMWAIGNEVTFLSKDCPAAPYDNITPVLRELHAVAKREDPSRVTTLADFTESVIPPLQGQYIAVGGISDIWAINQYYLWYSGAVARLGEQLDALHARYPNQPIGMSEYGAGAALTHHTDNVLGGPIENTNTGEPLVYQPEEYASYVHEQNYALLLSRNYVWGTYVWNMFDFGSGLRKEGDVQGVNTKGLVTFDRKTRKDPFYFYKANWSSEPVTYIVGRRYTNRAYPVTDVKIYSNADKVQLSVNGQDPVSMSQDQCLLKTCVFKNVRLQSGTNKIVAIGDHQGKHVSDSVEWTLNASGINIAAGQLETGFKSQSGVMFGSDNFFIGGVGDWLVEKGTRGVTDPTPVHGTKDKDLFKNYRRGQFSYYIPLDDGTYEVTLGFLEPDKETAVGNRLFDVAANDQKEISHFDVLKAAGGTYRTVVTRVFTTAVSGGHLKLDFIPIRGEAVVSNIMVRRQP